jgi:hypothetical protein
MLATLQKDYSEDVRSPGQEARGPSFDAARILRAFLVPDDFSGSEVGHAAFPAEVLQALNRWPPIQKGAWRQSLAMQRWRAGSGD